MKKYFYPINEENYLSPKELKAILEIEIVNLSIKQVRDMFILACFTGMHYDTIMELTPRQIHVPEKGMAYVILYPKMSSKTRCMPLLDLPLKILKQYAEDIPDGKCIFKPLVRQRISTHLKKLCEICNIHKNITLTSSRRTFVGLAKLNKMPRRKIEWLLGYHVPQVRNRQVLYSMQKLSKALKKWKLKSPK